MCVTLCDFLRAVVAVAEEEGIELCGIVCRVSGKTWYVDSHACDIGVETPEEGGT